MPSSVSSRAASRSRRISSERSCRLRDRGLADRACQEAKHRVRSGSSSRRARWPWKAGSPSISRRRRCARRDRASTCRSRSPCSPARTSYRRAAARARLRRRARTRRPGAPRRGHDRGRRRRAAGRSDPAALRGRVGPEAALAGIELVPVRHLAEAVAYLRGEGEPRRRRRRATTSSKRRTCRISPTCAGRSGVDGRSRSPRRAGTICCSRGRRGPARRCSARRLPGILPPLNATRRSR